MAALAVREGRVLNLDAALPVPVAHVLGVSPQEEVSRVAAGRVVAVVAHTESTGNGAVLDDVGESVCTDQATLEPDPPVPAGVCRSGPEAAAA